MDPICQKCEQITTLCQFFSSRACSPRGYTIVGATRVMGQHNAFLSTKRKGKDAAHNKSNLNTVYANERTSASTFLLSLFILTTTSNN